VHVGSRPSSELKVLLSWKSSCGIPYFLYIQKHVELFTIERALGAPTLLASAGEWPSPAELHFTPTSVEWLSKFD